jgi:hypothetical protein
MYISKTNCHTRIRLMSSERISLKAFYFHAQLTRMRQPVTFGELSNDVDTTGRDPMRVVASRVKVLHFIRSVGLIKD